MQNLLESLGYPGLAFLMLIENLFAPIPSELIMPLAGFAAGCNSEMGNRKSTVAQRVKLEWA
ncbi:hypothetical protein [Deinococcus sp.]|uniref:DedA family protein n=1 Tax=Deinococcus sp. TaxID=47478 RepID=UPI00344CA4C7